VPVPAPTVSSVPTSVPTHSYLPSNSFGPTLLPTVSTHPSTVPTPVPTTTCIPLAISGYSNGGSGITVTNKDGSSTGFSMSNGRGMNVAMFAGVSHALLSTGTYDTYANGNAQNELIAALNAVPDGTVVVMVVADEASLSLSASSRATISSLIGATLLGGMLSGRGMA